MVRSGQHLPLVRRASGRSGMVDVGHHLLSREGAVRIMAMRPTSFLGVERRDRLLEAGGGLPSTRGRREGVGSVAGFGSRIVAGHDVKRVSMKKARGCAAHRFRHVLVPILMVRAGPSSHEERSGLAPAVPFERCMGYVARQGAPRPRAESRVVPCRRPPPPPDSVLVWASTVATWTAASACAPPYPRGGGRPSFVTFLAAMAVCVPTRRSPLACATQGMEGALLHPLARHARRVAYGSCALGCHGRAVGTALRATQLARTGWMASLGTGIMLERYGKAKTCFSKSDERHERGRMSGTKCEPPPLSCGQPVFVSWEPD